MSYTPKSSLVIPDNSGNISVGNSTIVGSTNANQINLNGSEAQALHRSPNAVTSMFIYDTSKDSDGGAWTEKCQGTSWYNESLCGNWLGQKASEAAARLTGITNDYFQLTTDGKFYSLNQTSGKTEVFRGNKAKFPKLSAIVAEANNLTIYDLTEINRPMFWRDSTDSGYSLLCMLNGKLVTNSVGSPGVKVLDFPKDIYALKYRVSGYTLFSGNISGRKTNYKLYATSDSTNGILSNTIYKVDMTVLPNAPIDSITGLKIPTIALGTAGGVSVIRDNGTVSSNAFTWSTGYDWLSITKGYLLFGRATNYSGVQYIKLSSITGNTFTQTNMGQTGLIFNGANKLKALSKSSVITTNYAYALPIIYSKLNYQGLNIKSIGSRITNTYNTGMMIGDIKRCYLSDAITTGSITASNINNNIWFSNGDGNVVYDSGTNTVSISAIGVGINVFSGSVILTSQSNNQSSLTIIFTLYVDPTSTGAGVRIPSIKTSTAAYKGPYNISGTYVLTGVCGVFQLQWYCYSGFVGSISNVYCYDAITDRSYKVSGASIYGSLTKFLSSPNQNNQLIAYTGFSNTNYLQEPYSADLDFGTGEWSASCWVNIPVIISAISFILDRNYSSGQSLSLSTTSSGNFTSTVYDGTTSNTVSTTQAYNTGTWNKVSANYRSGKLSIEVNGTEVAVSTNRTPLLTLNNSNAVLTIGNNYALNAPFPGSLALLKLSATVPSTEQAVWMYEQEKQLFRDNANCVLPASTNALDLTYDDLTDRWTAIQAGYESTWSGLVRTSTSIPAGSYAGAVTQSGVKLLSRTTANAGVDISIPAYKLREEIVNKTENFNRTNQDIVTFTFDTSSFIATTTTGNNVLSSIGTLVQTPYVGMKVVTTTGTNIPTDTTIIGINGTTNYYLSASIVGSGTSGLQFVQSDFTLPVGYTTISVTTSTNGYIVREGVDYNLLFDGFVETIRFVTSPGINTWVKVRAVLDNQ